MKLDQQTVVVVGGSTGIGFAVAQLARAQGANVTITGRTENTLQAASEALGGAPYIVMDVARESDVNRAFAPFDTVDHVYVAAGSATPGGIFDLPVDAMMAPILERVWGAVYVIRAAARKIPPGGSLTFTGGVSTDRPVPGAWVSCIGTAAAEQMASVMALELAPVRVNAISPGWTDTPMWDRLLGDNKDGVLSGVAEKLPVRKIATATEVAEAVLLLMTNRSITGERLHVDGGARLV